jgi:hypothetical protein
MTDQAMTSAACRSGVNNGVNPEYYSGAIQGYNSFVLPFFPRFPAHLKPEQAEAIQALLNKSDLLCILPTGYGKTVCMLVPSIIMSKVNSGTLFRPSKVGKLLKYCTSWELRLIRIRFRQKLVTINLFRFNYNEKHSKVF